MKPSRLRAESMVRKELRVVIGFELVFLSHAEQLFRESAGEVEAAGEQANMRAIARLLSRAASDLRGMYLLLERGYGLQALTIAASVYEHLTMAAYIGGSEVRGCEWIGHDDPFKTPSPNHLGPEIQKRTAYNFVKVKRDNGKFSDAVYTMLCSAKHGNPLILSNHGVVTTVDGYFLHASPEFSPEIVNQARLSAYGIARGLVQSLLVLIEEGVLQEPESPRAAKAVALAEQSIERYSR